MPPNPDCRSYGKYARPYLANLLKAIRLDQVFHRAAGDYLWYHDETGQEVKVLDLLGGYGASLLGHNHPSVVATAREHLDAERPFNAQASTRAYAGALAETLSSLLQRTTNRSYVTTFASTGAEAVEAALKHAELERVRRGNEILAGLERASHTVKLDLRYHRARLSDSFMNDAARALRVTSLAGLDDLFMRLFRQATMAIDREPVFLAVEGAFHGKTTGAVKLTFNPEFHHPWANTGPKSDFVPAGDPDALARRVEESASVYYDVVIGDDKLIRLAERRSSNIAGLLVEPIQGEAGIRVADPFFLAKARTVADRWGFPLIFDEIQCGLGRTGSFVASSAAGVVGDYYLFAKSLGGGLAKASACAIDAERYVAEFGYLHSSTFADDDFSSAIALTTLNELARNDFAVAALCRRKGNHLLQRLTDLAREFPDQVRDVRGCGLMLGIELLPQTESSSPLIRVLSDQHLLSFVIAGHLLNEYGIRIAPTLSDHATIRVEPSAFVETCELDRFVEAFSSVLRALRDGDACRLTRFVMADRRLEAAKSSSVPVVRSVIHCDSHVGFLGHFAEAKDLARWESQLGDASDAHCELFLDRTRGLLDPFLVARPAMKSLAGRTVQVSVIAVPFTPKQVIDSLRDGDPRWAVELVEKGVELARQMGCRVVGFGGYTSIITKSCTTIRAADLSLTSGNALTAAAAVSSLLEQARLQECSTGRLGVVGATGNIGAVLGEVAADDVGRLLLVGRPRAERHLERVAVQIYESVAQRLRIHPDAPGLARVLAQTSAWNAVRRRGATAPGCLGRTLHAALSDELGFEAPVVTTTDMRDLRHCGMIISATNSPSPILTEDHVGDGPVVIADVAVPQDVDLGVLRKPQVVLMKGGMVCPPLEQSLAMPGFILPSGSMWGCMAETALMGLSGMGESFSYGPLQADKVRAVRKLALEHGFSFTPHPVET